MPELHSANKSPQILQPVTSSLFRVNSLNNHFILPHLHAKKQNDIAGIDEKTYKISQLSILSQKKQPVATLFLRFIHFFTIFATKYFIEEISMLRRSPLRAIWLHFDLFL